MKKGISFGVFASILFSATTMAANPPISPFYSGEKSIESAEEALSLVEDSPSSMRRTWRNSMKLVILSFESRPQSLQNTGLDSDELEKVILESSVQNCKWRDPEKLQEQGAPSDVQVFGVASTPGGGIQPASIWRAPEEGEQCLVHPEYGHILSLRRMNPILDLRKAREAIRGQGEVLAQRQSQNQGVYNGQPQRQTPQRSRRRQPPPRQGQRQAGPLGICQLPLAVLGNSHINLGGRSWLNLAFSNLCGGSAYGGWGPGYYGSPYPPFGRGARFSPWR